MRDQFCFGSVVSSLGKLASEKMGILDLVEVLCSGKEYNELNVRAVSETFCKKLAEGGSVDDLIQMVGSTGAPIDPSPISYPPGEQEPITLFGLPVTKPDVFIEALSKAELTTLYFLSRVSNKWLNIAREAFWKAITREVKSEVDGAVIKIDITIDLFLKADGQDVAHLGKAVEKWDELQYMYSGGGSGGGVADKFRVHVTTVRQLEENDDLAPVRDCIERIADVNGETPGNLLLAVHAVRAVLHGREKDLSVPAFYSNTLPAIEVPAGFTTIGDSAFSRCSSLASIELPASLTTIGESAFEGCSSLASIELPASITSILHSTFCRCSSLASVELPAGLSSIGFQVFWGCSSLQSIQLPAALRSIGVGAFEDCSSLSSIKLPASLTTIGNDAFSGCSSLASVVGLPASLTTIADRTFRDCSSLASIKLPANLTTIGENAFFSCSSLASIQLPDGLTTIGAGALSRCSSLASIKLPDGLTTIGHGAFGACSSLASVKLPASLTTIDAGAFRECSSLAWVGLPAGLTTIGISAFLGCSSLASIKLPAGLTTIGRSAFDGCTSLASVELPASLTTIGENAFRGCSRLTTLIIVSNHTGVRTVTTYLRNDSPFDTEAVRSKIAEVLSTARRTGS